MNNKNKKLKINFQIIPSKKGHLGHAINKRVQKLMNLIWGL